MKIEAKLEELGLTLPAAPTPMANYVTCRQVGTLLFFSGAGPFEEGKPVVFGKVGGELTQEQGYAAARLTGLNLIAQLRKELGDLDRIKQFVKVQAFVASVPNFMAQPAVMNGVSTCLWRCSAKRESMPALPWLCRSCPSTSPLKWR